MRTPFKALVYETPIDSDQSLIEKPSVASSTIRESPGIFERARRSLARRYQECIRAVGGTHEHIL